MEISKIEKNPVSKSLRMIYLDGEYAFSLYDNNLKELDLKEGDLIEDSILENKIYPIVYSNALKDALSYIARVNCTKGQVADKLHLRGYPKKAIDKAIEYATNKGFLDDYEFAQSYVKQCIKKGKGEKYIIFELSKKGISKEMTEGLLEEFEDFSQLAEIAQKRLDIILKGKERPEYKDLNKLKEYLLRQGHGYERISGVLCQIKEKYED